MWEADCESKKVKIGKTANLNYFDLKIDKNNNSQLFLLNISNNKNVDTEASGDSEQQIVVV